MKKLMLKSAVMAALVFVACNTNQNEMDEKEDTGIRPESASGDSTVTDEINATGNAQSGPDEGP